MKNSVKFSNYLSNHWTNISSIKQIVFHPKIFGIRSLFILFHLVSHQIVDTEMNTAASWTVQLATLGDTTQIEIILSVLCCPRWPRQVQWWLSHAAVTDIVIYKLHQCTRAFTKKFYNLEPSYLVKGFLSPFRKDEKEKVG